jgi:uncharacterized RDD family membrane protein YckC
MTATSFGLPDPATLPAFYQGVTAKRGIAWVIDTVLIAIVAAAVLPLTLFTGIFFFPLMIIFAGFFYRWAMLRAASATFGMMLMAIEFRDHQGARLTPAAAFSHTLLFSISTAVPPLQLLSICAMILTPRGQGLTDHLLGTAAINRPA